MKKLVFLSLIAFTAQLQASIFPAPGYYDRTEAMMKEEGKNGIELLTERAIEGVQVKLYLAKSAKDAIAKGAFLVPDPAYNQEKLNSFILDAFEGSLTYFREIDPANEIKELNLVLLDKGGDTGTISETGGQTRVMELHLVRWHKYMVKNTSHFVSVSSVHEFAHVINYMYSPKETKYHREMAAVLVECLHLIQLLGIENFSKIYLKSFTTKMTDLAPVTSGTYSNMNVIRNIAYVLMKNIYAGAYKGPQEPVKLAEGFVMSYLKNPLDDYSGFDGSLKELGLLDSEGKALTFNRLQEDTKASLSVELKSAPELP